MPQPVLVVERVARHLTLLTVLSGEAGEVAPQPGKADPEIVLAHGEAEKRGEPKLVRAGENRFLASDLLLTQGDDARTEPVKFALRLGEHAHRLFTSFAHRPVMSDDLTGFCVLGCDGRVDPQRLDELGDHGNLRSGGVVDSAFKTFHGYYFQE